MVVVQQPTVLVLVVVQPSISGADVVNLQQTLVATHKKIARELAMETLSMKVVDVIFHVAPL